MFFIVSILAILWLFCFVFAIYILYKKNSKPHLSSFLSYLLEEAPCERKPNELSMLMERKIGVKTFVSTFFYLIEKKVISVEKKEGDTIFTISSFQEGEIHLSLHEQCFLSIFFDDIGSQKQVRLSQMASFCKTYQNRTHLLMEYTIWKRMASSDIQDSFFEYKTGSSMVSFLCIFGISLLLLNFLLQIHSTSIYAICIPIFFLYFYFQRIYKRTESANTEYFQWTAFKRYLLNLSSPLPSVFDFYIANLIGFHALKDSITQVDFYKLDIEKVITKMIQDAILHGGRNF